MFKSVLAAYGLEESSSTITPFGTGLINFTWKLRCGGKDYVLQQLNEKVFANPGMIDHNIDQVATYLRNHHPDYFFTAPLKTKTGQTLFHAEGVGYFRLFDFVSGSHSKDVVETPDQAFEAAKQFGRFTKQFSGIDITQLHDTIPAFHDLSLRHRQFLQALQDGNAARITETGRMIQQLLQWSPIEVRYRQLVHNPDFKLRVTHHDTKISNVLFDSEDKCICVIDLDTVMPGYFISDVGDMMRTYLSPVSEEEEDFTKIEVRTAFYEAVVSGYFSEMKDELTKTEKEHFFYAGTFMIYMQALRFLTDYLNNDEYYGARYPGHNRVRAENQVVLLQRLLEKQHALEGILLESV